MKPSNISSLNGVRFAPSPTGDFHVGNLRTAWISHWWARALDVPWMVRFEDIDIFRSVPQIRERQLAQMALLDLLPDKILLQSERRERHFQLFVRAISLNQIYPCFCSRRDLREAIEDMANAPHGKIPIYNGACRYRQSLPSHYSYPTIAWRWRDTDDNGDKDFIIARTAPISSSDLLKQKDEKTFVPGYQWACAIDDWEGNYHLLVRAWDLADSLEHQRKIQTWLTKLEGHSTDSQNKDFQFPAVYHTAMITTNDGIRLQKRNRNSIGNNFDFHTSQLKEIFALSFQGSPTEFQLSKVWGETKTTISLRELGLT